MLIYFKITGYIKIN